MEADQRKRDLVKQTSAEADLIIMGFNESFLRKGEVGYFQGYEGLCNILFVGVPNERNAKIN